VLPDIDPSYTPEAVAYRVIRGVFDSLVYEGSNGQFTPWLATSWTANSTSYTFTLRKGVTFSDGTPLNAQAVKYTFDRIESPAEGSLFAISLLGPYKGSVVNSPYSVTVNFSAPYPGFLEAASQAFLGIVDPTAAKKEAQPGPDPGGAAGGRGARQAAGRHPRCCPLGPGPPGRLPVPSPLPAPA
jgi:peptide/nickel transport system substrate-binding protein